MKVVQLWRGLVDNINDKTFGARLHGVIGETEEIYADIYIDAVPEHKRQEIEPGRYIDWYITDDGTPDGNSYFHFPVYVFSQRQWDEAREWGKRMAELFEED